MRGILRAYGKKRVFILGAGFSAPLGMPLTTGLLKGVHEVAASKVWYRENGEPSPNGMADWLLEELNWYFPLASFNHADIRLGSIPVDFDLEKFLSLVAATSAMQYKTGERWNEHGDKFTAFMKAWLGEFIERQQRSALKNIPNHYLRLAASLLDSVVLTFNWDTVVETLLEQVGISYAFDLPSTYGKDMVPLIKLHGSLDWFSMNTVEEKPGWMEFAPIGKSFEGIGRAKGDVLQYHHYPFLTPWIITPGYDKIFQMINLGDIWQIPWMFLQDELEVIIIGFSMRPDDYHSRAFIYPQLVEGSRSGNLKVKVIDLATTPEQRADIEQRFVGVKDCQFFLEGFSEKALSFIEHG